MEKVNNIFTVDNVVEEDSYIKVTGNYLIPENLPFERGDILTEDKYSGHQIYVAFTTKDENGKDGLILDTKSMHPSIKKSLNKVSSGLKLFKIEDMAETVVKIPEGIIEVNEAKVLSFGEQLVGIEFNSSNDDKVAKVKELFAEAANILKDAYQEGPGNPIKSLLFDHAVGELVSAQMAVVKVITFK